MTLVKNRLLYKCNELDQLSVNFVFGQNTFNFFSQMANDPNLSKMKDEHIILEMIEQERAQKLKETIHKFGNLFVQEFRHFVQQQEILNENVPDMD